MDNVFDKVKVFFELNPHYAYLLISIVLLVMAIGSFMNKGWAIDPANSTQKHNYEVLGHNGFRIGKGIIFLLGALGSFYGFWANL